MYINGSLTFKLEVATLTDDPNTVRVPPITRLFKIFPPLIGKYLLEALFQSSEEPPGVVINDVCNNKEERIGV